MDDAYVCDNITGVQVCVYDMRLDTWASIQSMNVKKDNHRPHKYIYIELEPRSACAIKYLYTSHRKEGDLHYHHPPTGYYEPEAYSRA